MAEWAVLAHSEPHHTPLVYFQLYGTLGTGAGVLVAPNIAWTNLYDLQQREKELVMQQVAATRFEHRLYTLLDPTDLDFAVLQGLHRPSMKLA
jgi:hypothetical protein